MKKLKPFFAASAADGTLELSVYEDIGSDWFGDGVSAKTVKSQIDAAGPVNRIAVRINSPGGDAFEGVAIYNLLRSLNKPVDVYVDGIAASAASIIAMAGDTITLGANAMLMIHDAWMMCAGNATELRATADILDRVSAAIAQTYIARTGLSKDEIGQMMSAETWMGAEECLEKGFCTAIAEYDDSERAMALAASFPRLQKLKNLPEQFRAAAKPAETTEPAAPPVEEKPIEPSNLSLYEAQFELLGRR